MTELEAIARRIAIAHELDPDDERLGYPAWKIDWILEQARKEIQDRKKQMKYPWENIPEEKSMLSDLDTYINFMDKHVRVRTFKDGVQIGTFSIVSDGTDLGAEISLQNGSVSIYRIVVAGHPNTHDPIMTPEELASYLLTV